MEFMTGQNQNTSALYEELPELIGKEVALEGTVYKIRQMSGFSFIILQMPRNLLQCVAAPENCSFDIHTLKEQSAVRLTGIVASEPRSRTGYEVQIKNIEILSQPYEELPVVINGKSLNASLETLLDYRPLTMRNEAERAIFRIQDGVCRGFRDFLSSNGFTELHTPKIVFAGAEGGANIFRLNYFGKEVYLTQSPQFYKQMMTAVYHRVFEIGPVFRAEHHDTNRHLNEYTSVDLEIAFINSFKDIMNIETDMLSHAFDYLKLYYSSELELLQIQLPDTSRIPAIPFCEAKELVKQAYHRSSGDPDDFEPEEERLLCELVKNEYHSEFVFVTHYPTKKRPFYALEDPENTDYTLSFDLLFRGIEITTGGQRIHDYACQLEKMKRLGMDPEEFQSYLMMHRCGMPPHGGLGLGLERLTSKLLGKDNVRYAALFPRDINRVTP